MSQKLWSESQAWEKMARAFYNQHQGDPSYYGDNDNPYICPAISDLHGNGFITEELKDKMRNIIMEDVKLFNNTGSLFHLSIKESENVWYLLRGDYCMLQSYMTEKGD